VTKLATFNNALTELGHTSLEDTGEGVEAGRLLNQVWERVVNDCLSVGSWNFAMETIQADADTGIVPEFGYTEVFLKPEDWVRTIGVSDDEDFTTPLLDYYDDMTFWSAPMTPIYIRYVSNDTGMGFELTRWPAAFTRYAELELALRVCPKIAKSEWDRVVEMRDKAKRTALNQDAMNEPQPKYPPAGNWTTARGGGSRERGRRGSLTG
jgi:hypothetical protein